MSKKQNPVLTNSTLNLQPLRKITKNEVESEAQAYYNTGYIAYSSLGFQPFRKPTEEEVAYHEAGHVALFLLYRFKFKFVTVFNDQERGSYGFVRTYGDLVSDTCITSRKPEIHSYKWCIATLAGDAVQKKYLNDDDWNYDLYYTSFSDYEKCLMTIKILLLKKMSMATYAQLSERGVSESFITDKTVDKIAELYQHAQSIIEKPEIWEFITCTANLLLKEKVISYKKCVELFNSIVMQQQIIENAA